MANQATGADPQLVDSGVVFSDGTCFSNNIVLYSKNRRAYAKVLNPTDLTDQSYILQDMGGWNHFDFEMIPNGEGCMAFSGSNERMFYRKVDSDFVVQSHQYINFDGAHNWVPKVSGENLIWCWAQSPYNQWDVKLENIDSNTRAPLAEGPANQYALDIEGQYALYWDDGSVYYKKIWGSDDAVEILAEDGATLGGDWDGGMINQNRILTYTQDRQKIYIYDIGTDTYARKVLEENDYDITNPYLYGDLLVWSDDRNGSYDIYGLDISNNDSTPFQITDSDSTDEKYSLVYEDLIVWGQGDIGFNGNIGVDLYAAKIFNCVNKPSMDFNNDCQVNLIDLAEFAQEWLLCGYNNSIACD